MTTRERVGTWLKGHANTPSGHAWGAVILADYKGLAETLERFGKEATGTVHGALQYPVTALTAGAVRGDTLAVTMLLDAGAHPAEKGSGHLAASPIAWAIEADSLGCVRRLLAALQRVGISQPQDEDWSDMAIVHHDYISHPDPDILQALLEGGARATQGALCRSISHGIQQAVELLLDHGADPNGRDERTGENPLGWCVAALGGTANRKETTGPAILTLLLGRSADPKRPCGEPGTRQPPVLVAAVEAGATWAIQQLIDAGANRDQARDYVRRHGLETSREKTALDALRAII